MHYSSILTRATGIRQGTEACCKALESASVCVALPLSNGLACSALTDWRTRGDLVSTLNVTHGLPFNDQPSDVKANEASSSVFIFIFLVCLCTSPFKYQYLGFNSISRLSGAFMQHFNSYYLQYLTNCVHPMCYPRISVREKERDWKISRLLWD